MLYCIKIEIEWREEEEEEVVKEEENVTTLRPTH